MKVFPFAVTNLRSFDWSFYCSKISLFTEFPFCDQSLREMENFRGIAEESIPSFLTNSLLGNSEILENVTLSSNLGLPVAVSTLARNRSGTDNRYPDTEASYLVEGRFSVPSESSPSSQSEAEPREKLHLSFQDDDSISKKKNPIEGQHLSDAGLGESSLQSDITRTGEEQATTAKPLQSQDPYDRISPLEQVQDSPVDVCLQSWLKNKDNKIVVPHAGRPFEDKNPHSDLSHTSLLENEKLPSLRSLEDSSVDDDIDDEEFYDEHLEAYFEQLAIPGMIYEDLGQEPPENDFKLPTSDSCQANENGSLNYKSQAENNSSPISDGSHSLGSSETTHKESEVGHVACLPGISNFIDTGDSRRHVGGVLSLSSSTRGIEQENEREDSLKGIVPHHGREISREEVPVKTIQAANAKLNPVYFHDTNANKGEFDLVDLLKLDAVSLHEDKHLASNSEIILPMDKRLDTETPKVSIQKYVDKASLKPVSDNGIISPNSLRSPTIERRIYECYKSIEKSKEQTDLSPSVVYQNEEGRWVTDLAYYTSFNKEQVLNMSLADEMNEDFRSGSEALDLIDQDEEEFNKEHQFMQEENIDARNTSAALGDTSWGTSINYSLLRKSLSTSDLDKDDASYLRLSLGEFFAQRSEALGSLGGGYNVKRPSFGYFIRSPEKREPVALIRKSDVSRSNLEKEMTLVNHDIFSGDLKTQPNEGSVTLQAEELESISQMNESDKTLTVNNSKTEDNFFMSSKPQRDKSKIPTGGDSVLRISTIASAIADASVSTDPSQLAAMIKALSNKTREKTFKKDNKQKDYSTLSHFLPSDTEKSSGSSMFDMEKYLKKTEVSRYEGGLENFSRASTSDIWDLSLPKEQTTQDIHTVDLGATNKNIREPEENTVYTFYGENGKSENQESCRTNFPHSILTNRKESENTVVDVKTCPIDNKLPDIGNCETAPSVSTPKSDSYSLVRNPRIASVWLSEECEEIPNNGENQRQNECASEASNSEKHVTFGKHCIVAPKNVDLQNYSPGHGSEDDQDSFRPSSSPLNHSSPSETSGTSLSGCALESFGSAAPQKPPCESESSPLVCPQASVSRLTYVSEQESTCPTTASDHGLEDRKSDVTSELTSTIIQASPVPSEERAMEKQREKAKPFPMHPVGTNCGIEPWDSGILSGFGKVRVPEELKFPHACCVGIASQTYLSVLNPADRWLQVSIGVLTISINGEKVDLSAYPCLVFKNKVIIRPHATEEIKVLFIPSDSGIFRCIFSVASWPFSADAETIAQAEALASRVILTAVAETPVIEVDIEKKDVLDFGDLTYGSWKALPLKLINKTHATVPIRLVINANAAAWRCFTFSKAPIHASWKETPYADVIAQLAAPSVVNHVMPASYDGQDPEFLIIWVLFHSPKKRITSSEILDSAEEFLARVDIEVDSPNPTPVIKSVRLQARTGIARIHAPKDLQTMHLFASVASSTKQHLPLKNAGNIDVYLDIRIPDQGSHFSVDPENLFLKPGEEREVTVTFTPEDPKTCEERILKIFVQPFGPQYEVVLKGEVVSSGNKPLTPGSCCSDVPSILSNKQFLAWGGVPLGRTQLQKLALRNNCTATTQHLRLLIRGQDQDCFQLQHTFGSEERLTSNCEIRMCPKEDVHISVLFAPTRLSCMLAKLEIKQLGIRSQPGIKFTIPLSGYGGTSNLILEDVKKLSDSYMVTVNDLIPGKESRIVFSVHNTGSRAAFVKAIGFKDSQKKVLLDPKVLRIFPDKFVLKEKTREDVTIIYNPLDRKNNYTTTTELSTIYFFGGDEISRQQYRRALLHKPGIIEQVLPEHSVLQNVDFAETFQDELLVTEVYDLPQRPNDIQLFYGNMRKIILSVIGEFRDSVSSSEFLQPSSKLSLESKSESDSSGKHGGNVSLDVLPVKGPQGSPLLSQAACPPQDKSSSREMWTVQPEHLILMAPSPCGLAKTARFQILNNSIRLLKFELYWPAHCLTVTPQHGFIPPESKLQILVSPNSSLSTKHSMFPWSGFIYIHCDNGQKKVVKVQIREDLTQKELTHLASSSFGILSPETDPSVSHLVKPMTKPPSTKVEIRNKTVTFPATEPGETSENCLELENHGNAEVKWHLSSLAPPYVKGVDDSGDVFRATYAAFRCSPISGILESRGIQKVSITFLPRDRGDYAQFWDVECNPLKEPHRKHTLRFQLSGQSVKAENEPEGSQISTNSLIKLDNLVMPRRQGVSETALIPSRQLDLTHRGVYASEDVYRFLPTRVGESRTLKVNLRNNSFIMHSLKFLSPREPFYVKHSKYSLRAQHYINMPVQFRPKSVGKFEALLVVQTDEGKSVAIRLMGEALEKIN
uniref:centrosomal protein of 192 kDa isoform X6 n=1 Tax=Nyctereutes procyonoides TaxID=34880 RepID=UPI002443C3FE|nr:centrosomal protein of 192 kDa isoform X6 [Nyctereutes procyonoides]